MDVIAHIIHSFIIVIGTLTAMHEVILMVEVEVPMVLLVIINTSLAALGVDMIDIMVHLVVLIVALWVIHM